MWRPFFFGHACQGNTGVWAHWNRCWRTAEAAVIPSLSSADASPPGRGWQQIPFSPPYETNDREADVTDHDIGIRKEHLPGSATCGWEWQDSR